MSDQKEPTMTPEQALVVLHEVPLAGVEEENLRRGWIAIVLDLDTWRALPAALAALEAERERLLRLVEAADSHISWCRYRHGTHADRLGGRSADDHDDMEAWIARARALVRAAAKGVGDGD